MARWGFKGRGGAEIRHARGEHVRPLSAGGRRMQSSVTLASAVLISQQQLRAMPEQRGWQALGWDFYDAVGELHAVMQWTSNSISRCRLYVGELPDDATQGDPVPTDNDRAQEPLDELFDGRSGQSEMLSRHAVQLQIPGESYAVAMDLDGQRRWLVCSREEVERSNRELRVRLPETDRPVKLDLGDPDTGRDGNATLMRLWRPHPRRAWEADSPTRAAMPVLEELVGYQSHIKASIESRLAGAGILFIPESASLPVAKPSPQGQPLHEDPAMATLIDAMITPIGNRDSAAAVVPILVRLPDGAMGKAQYMTFNTPLDANLQKLRTDALRRLALTLDVPPEIMLGMADANHWTSWQVAEEAVKLTVEPLLQVIADAYTRNYLQPALIGMGIADPRRYVIWYDTSELVLRPNRGEQAAALHEQGMLGWRTVLRESGFSEEDYPGEGERAADLLRALALSGIDPAVAAPYLTALALPTVAVPAAAPAGGPGQPPAITSGPAGGPGGGRDIPATPGAPGTTPPGTTPPGNPAANATAAGVWRLAAVEIAVLRALEIAGKRLLSGNGRALRGTVHCPTWDIHTVVDPASYDPDRLLDGAYDTLDNSVLAAEPCTRVAVDRYVRALLQARQPHRPRYLAAALQQAGCISAADAATLTRTVEEIDNGVH